MIQDWHKFLRMTGRDPDRILYKVVFGSPKDVAAEIGARLKKNA